MSLLDRRSLPLAFVEDIQAPLLSDTDEHHLRKSLRLRDGAALTVSDGRGHFRFVTLGHVGDSVLDVLSDPTFEVQASPSLAVGFAPIKAQKAEWLVQKLTELGVDRIQPLLTDRMVIRWNEKKQTAMGERLAIAAREASMQCRRVWLPEIAPPRSIADVIAESAGSFDVVLADPAGEPLRSPEAMVLIGPEGGWSDREAAATSLVRLPGNVLRAETAVVVAGAMLCDLRDHAQQN